MNAAPSLLENLVRVATSHDVHVKEEDDTTSLGKQKSKRMACVECRQQKSKCDAHEKYPNPCTRCQKKSLRCDLKSDYKRTYKRARIAQIEKEFSELKRLLTQQQLADMLAKIPSLAQSKNTPVELPRGHLGFGSPFDSRLSHNLSETLIPNTPQIRADSVPVQGYSLMAVEIPDYVLACDDKQLDLVLLSLGQIRELYTEYVERYHPILPLVDVSKGPERIYKLCPALFWVMMFVSLRRFRELESLLLQLLPLVKGVLAEIMISPITRYNPTEEEEPIINGLSVYAIQAFLLYSYWPPITSSLSADSSYNTVGNAMLMAIRIGLQTPVQAMATDVNVAPTTLPYQLAMAQENAKTWIALNTVSQTIALAFGFPGFVQFDSLVWNLLSHHNVRIPFELRYMMEIAYFEDQVARALNSNPQDLYGLANPNERLPLLKLLGRRLDELETRMMTDLPQDRWRRFQLLCARVRLLTYYFIDFLRIALFEIERGLVQLFNLAIALINHTATCQNLDRKFVKYLPSVYILNIWQAACIVAKLTHSQLKKVIDVGSGKAAYEAAISLAAKALILKHDIAHRLLGIMRNMWQLFRALDAKHMSTLSVTVRGRMAALVFFDCLHIIRDQVGMMKLNNRTREETDELAILSGEDDHLDQEQPPPLAKLTPGSTTLLQRRRRRSLLQTINAESKARKIIRTIPLDPQPILVTGLGRRLTIFKVVNSLSDSGQLPAELKKYGDLPLNGFDHVELDNFDLNDDLLWKDVDSVMNDFGFNI